MNKTFKKLTYSTLLGATLLGGSSISIFANEVNHHTTDTIIETTTLTDQTVVNIPDNELLEQIRDELGKYSGDITVGDMKKLTYLGLMGDIKSLEGLEHAINLDTLVIIGTSITDLNPIKELKKIEQLAIMMSPTKDLSALSGLTNLKDLQLAMIPSTDLSPITGLTKIESFGLMNTNITDLSPLKNSENIESVFIFNNSLNGLEQLRQPKYLDSLLIGGTSLNNLAPIKNFTDLETLILMEEYPMGLNLFKGIDETKLANNTTITPDLPSLKGLKNLKQLVMLGKSFTNLNGIEGLTNLQTLILMEDLSLMGMNVSQLPDEFNMFIPTTPTDLTPLKGLTNLEMLMLMGRSYNDLNGLEGLTNLQVLFLMATPVEDLSPLAKLSNLKGLMLGFTNVYDFSPLEHLELDMLQILPLQASIKNIQLTKNTLKNPYQFSDGTYLKFKKLQDGMTQSEDGSTFYFENPQKGETYLLITDICFELNAGNGMRTNHSIKNEWAQSLLNKFNKNKMYFDCSELDNFDSDENGTNPFGTEFGVFLTIDGLMGETNPTLNIGEQTDNQKTITIDFTDSFYPIERIILPDGTEVKGNQATFVVSETNDYIFKAYDSQGNEYIETQYVEIESATAPDEEDTPSDENKPNEENKPSIPEEDTPSDTDKPSTPDQPSVEPDQDESDKDEVKPSNPNEENQESSQPNDNQNSSNQTETHKPTQRPTVEAGLSSIGLIGLGFVSLISGAVYLKRKRK